VVFAREPDSPQFGLTAKFDLPYGFPQLYFVQSQKSMIMRSQEAI